jgi:hypothetical protein
MSINFKKLNLRQKMIFTIIPALLVVFTILGGGVYLYVKEVLEAEGRNEANLIAHDFASQMETELAIYYEIQKQFNLQFSHYEKISNSYKRKFYVDLSYSLLEKSEKLLAV